MIDVRHIKIFTLNKNGCRILPSRPDDISSTELSGYNAVKQ